MSRSKLVAQISASFVALALSLVAGCGADSEPLVVGELASDRIELAAEAAEPIVSIEVAEGDTVSAGTILLRQDDRRARARLAEVDAQVAELEARLAELERGPRGEAIDQVRARLDAAERDAAFRLSERERARGVAARGLTSKEALQRAETEYDSAAATLALRRSELEEALAGTTVEELRQAEQRLAQARARRDAAVVDLDKLTITAPVDGIVDTRLVDIGERPAPGQPLLVLLSGEQVFARVYVPAALRTDIVAGSAVEVHADGFERSFPGRVRWVASEPAFTPYFALTERDRGHLTYLAKIDIESASGRLPDGIPVTVRIGQDAD